MSATDITLKRQVYRDLHILVENDSVVNLPSPRYPLSVESIRKNRPLQPEDCVDLILESFGAAHVDLANNVATIIRYVKKGYKLRTYPKPRNISYFVRQVVIDIEADMAEAKCKHEIYRRLGLVISGCSYGTVGIITPYQTGHAQYILFDMTEIPKLSLDGDIRAYFIVDKIDHSLSQPVLASIKPMIDAIAEVKDLDHRFPLNSFNTASVAEWEKALTDLLESLLKFKEPAVESKVFLPLAQTSSERLKLFFQQGDLEAIYQVTDPDFSSLISEVDKNGCWKLTHPKPDQRVQTQIFISAREGESNPWVRMAVDFALTRDHASVYIFTSKDVDRAGSAAILYERMLR